MLRVATAAVLAPLVWAVVVFAPPWAFALATMLVVGIAVHECCGLLAGEGSRPFVWIAIVGAAAAVWTFAGHAPHFELGLPLTGTLAAATALSMRLRDDPPAMLRSTIGTVVPVVMIGVGLGYLVALRRIPGETGRDLVFVALICVVFADTAAYYVGRRFGKHRLAPRLSPSKSWEGAIGGVLAAVVAALIAHFTFYTSLGVVHAVAIGLILGPASILGDLAESMVKRAGGAKDSSRLLPGHGGVFDRTDSLLFAGAVLYYYHHAFFGIST